MALPTYVKTIWVNNQAPARDETNLNNQENGIELVTNAVIYLEGIVADIPTTYVLVSDIGTTVVGVDEIGQTVQPYNAETVVATQGVLPPLNASLLTNLPSGFADPMTTRGDIIYRNNLNATARLPLGTNKQVLSSDGTDLVWATALLATDLGSTVQAYDVNNALKSHITYEQLAANGDIGTGAAQVAQGDHGHSEYAALTGAAFTGAVSAGLNTTGDNSIAFNDKCNFSFTATAANITVTNQTVGQSGVIVIASAENITGWGTEFDFGSAGAPIGLTGVETFGYFISGASGVDSIKIGHL